MADSTVTIDTNEWKYVDSFGIEHTVTNAETFSLTVTDGGAAAVSYNIPLAQSVVTDDGYTIYFRPECENSSGTGGSAFRTIGLFTDAGQASAFYQPPTSGELVCECPVSGRIQRWKPVTITPSDADYGAAGTIAAVFEDQFGNRMTIASGTTVGQAGA